MGLGCMATCRPRANAVGRVARSGYGWCAGRSGQTAVVCVLRLFTQRTGSGPQAADEATRRLLDQG